MVLQATVLMCMSHTLPKTHRHTHKLTRTPEPLTKPVFTSDLSKSLTIGLPSSEEIDRAVLSALDHLHSQDSEERGQGSDEIHLTDCFMLLCDDSFKVSLLVAELIQNSTR